MSERENVLRFCAEQRSEMERVWKKLGRYESNGNAYNAWVQATHEPVGPKDDRPHGPPLPRPKWMRVELPLWISFARPNERNTDIFGDVLRALARTSKANGVIIMSEMWFKKYEGADTYEKARELRRQDPKNLAEAQGRAEALFLSLEHVHVGRRSWMAEIHRNPDKLSPWDERNMDDAPLDAILHGIVNTGS